MFRRFILGFVLVCAVLVSGSSLTGASSVHAAPVRITVAAPAASPAHLFDKTRVILHLALAYGVFHRWVYKPWKAGMLSVRHPINVVKAGTALLFAVHEVKAAYSIAKGSNDGTLKSLSGVLGKVVSQFSSAGSLFKSGPSGLTDAQIGSTVSGLNTLVGSSNKILNAPDASVLPGF